MSDLIKRLCRPGYDLQKEQAIQEAIIEIRELRAKIKAMEQQKPVAQVGVHKTGGNAGIAWSARPLNEFDSLPLLRDGDKLYLAPGAQPAPSVPVDLITDYLVSISAHVAHQDDPKAQAEIGELLRMLAAIPCAQPAPIIPEGWLRAIDEALVVAHIGMANADDTYEQAKAKLDNLIGFHVDVATDPAVNGGWKLVPVEILDRFPEINQNNYNHDDVCNLNAWGVELVLAAAPEAKL